MKGVERQKVVANDVSVLRGWPNNKRPFLCTAQCQPGFLRRCSRHHIALHVCWVTFRANGLFRCFIVPSVPYGLLFLEGFGGLILSCSRLLTRWESFEFLEGLWEFLMRCTEKTLGKSRSVKCARLSYRFEIHSCHRLTFVRCFNRAYQLTNCIEPSTWIFYGMFN